MIFFALTLSRQTMEDIRGTVPTDNSTGLLILAAILLGLAGLAYHLWPGPKPKGAPLPREIAKNRLNEVSTASENTGLYELAIGLSSILRSFLEQQYGLKTISRTTQEFLVELGMTNCLNPFQKNALYQFFATVDQVKFAHAIPPEERADLVAQAANFIEQAP